MTERLEPLKLKRRIIKALARRSSGFNESPPPFFHPAPPTYIFFPPFFPPPPPPTVLFLVSFPLVLFLFFSLSFLFYFFIFLHFFTPVFSLFLSLSFPPPRTGASCASLQLAFCFPPRPCRGFKTQECDRVQPSSGVARGRRENCAILSRHLPISRYVNWESRENSWGTESRSIRRNNAHRFCALSEWKQ